LGVQRSLWSKIFFLNVPSVRQGVTIFCAPKNMGTNVYSAMKKKFEDILKNGREIVCEILCFKNPLFGQYDFSWWFLGTILYF